EAIVATSNELNIPAITQILKLLPNLGPDILIARIETAKVALESIDFVEREIALSQRLDTFHHIKQPAARFQRFIPEEERFLPFLKNHILRPNDAALDNMNLPGLGYAIEPNFRPDPDSSPRGGGKRLAFLDDVFDEEMLWHDEQIDDGKGPDVVVH